MVNGVLKIDYVQKQEEYFAPKKFIICNLSTAYLRRMTVYVPFCL